MPAEASHDSQQRPVQASDAPDASGVGPAAPAPRKKGVPGWVRLVISLALLGWLVLKIEVGDVVGIMLKANPWWSLFSLALLWFAAAYGAYKWWLLMPRGKQPLRLFVRVTFISNFVGMFLPGVVGIEASRVVGLAKSSNDLAAALSSVMVDRLFGLLALMIMVKLGLSISSVAIPPDVALLSTILLVAMIVMVIAMMSRHCRAAIEKLMPKALATRVDKVYVCLDSYRSRPVLLLGSLVLNLGFQGIRVVLMWAAAMALGVDVALSFWVVVVPVVLFIQMLPISVYGLGVREVAMIKFLALAGVSEQSAVAVSLYFFALTVIHTLPGALLMMTSPKVAEASSSELESEDPSSETMSPTPQSASQASTGHHAA